MSGSARSPGDSVARFAAAAAEWGKANAASDWRRANGLHDELVAALREVAVGGGGSIGRVLALMEDADDAVAGWAATFALRFEPARAMDVLARLAKRPGLAGHAMEVTLREWRKGTLEFAWEAGK